MAARNKILVAGHSPHSRGLLLQSLLGAAAESSSIASADVAVYPSKFDTRYYSADVEYWNVATDNLEDSSLSSAGDVADALVLLFDVFQETSFQKIQRWLPFIERHSPSVLLCVGAFDSDQRPEAHREYFDSEAYATHTEWCLENGIEFVSMVETPADRDEDPAFRERFGAERVLEALHAHTWPGMVFKTDLRPRDAARGSSRRSAEDSEEEASQPRPANGVANGHAHDLSAPPPAELASAEAAAVGQLARLALLQSMPKQEDEMAAAEREHALLDDKMSFEQLSRKFMRGLNDPDSLEETMAQLSLLRLKAQSMPDAERRELAAQLALALCDDLGDEADDL